MGVLSFHKKTLLVLPKLLIESVSTPLGEGTAFRGSWCAHKILAVPLQVVKCLLASGGVLVVSCGVAIF